MTRTLLVELVELDSRRQDVQHVNSVAARGRGHHDPRSLDGDVRERTGGGPLAGNARPQLLTFLFISSWFWQTKILLVIVHCKDNFNNLPREKFTH